MGALRNRIAAAIHADVQAGDAAPPRKKRSEMDRNWPGFDSLTPDERRAFWAPGLTMDQQLAVARQGLGR